MRRAVVLPLALLLLAPLLTPLGQAFHWGDQPVLATTGSDGAGWVAWRVTSLDAPTLLEVDVDERGDSFAFGVYVIEGDGESIGLTMWGSADDSGTRVGSTLVGDVVVVVGADGSGSREMSFDVSAHSAPSGTTVEREIIVFLSGDVGAWRATLRDPGATTLLDSASSGSAFYLDLHSSPALLAADVDAAGSAAEVTLQGEAIVEAEGRLFGSVFTWGENYVCAGVCLGASHQSVTARTPDGSSRDCGSSECAWRDAASGTYAFRTDVVDVASGARLDACIAQAPTCAEARGEGVDAVFVGADVQTPW